MHHVHVARDTRGMNYNGFHDHLSVEHIEDCPCVEKERNAVGIPVKVWDAIPDCADSALSPQRNSARDRPGAQLSCVLEKAILKIEHGTTRPATVPIQIGLFFPSGFELSNCFTHAQNVATSLLTPPSLIEQTNLWSAASPGSLGISRVGGRK